MKRVLCVLLFLLPAAQVAAELSIADRKTADLIIKQCRDIYKHKRPCPCPYDQAKNEDLCSTASAYDKKAVGGLFCERSDVKPEDITNFRNLNESFITARCTAR